MFGLFGGVFFLHMVSKKRGGTGRFLGWRCVIQSSPLGIRSRNWPFYELALCHSARNKSILWLGPALGSKVSSFLGDSGTMILTIRGSMFRSSFWGRFPCKSILAAILGVGSTNR